jgi:hypothetical protein
MHGRHVDAKGRRNRFRRPSIPASPSEMRQLFIPEAALLKVVLMLVPNRLIAVTAVIAISAAIKPYSIAVAALLFLISFRMKNIPVSRSLSRSCAQTHCAPALFPFDVNSVRTFLNG